MVITHLHTAGNWPHQARLQTGPCAVPSLQIRVKLSLVNIEHVCHMSSCRVETSAKPYLPSQADAGPASFLLWLEKYGGGGPPTSTLQDVLGGASPGEVCKGRG